MWSAVRRTVRGRGAVPVGPRGVEAPRTPPPLPPRGPAPGAGDPSPEAAGGHGTRGRHSPRGRCRSPRHGPSWPRVPVAAPAAPTALCPALSAAAVRRQTPLARGTVRCGRVSCRDPAGRGPQGSVGSEAVSQGAGSGSPRPPARSPAAALLSSRAPGAREASASLLPLLPCARDSFSRGFDGYFVYCQPGAFG